MEYPGGYTANYAYDPHGRLSTLTDGEGNLIASYQYNGVGEVTRQDNGNGTYTISNYYPTGLLKETDNHAPDGEINSFFAYTYDSIGRELTQTTSEWKSHYIYDSDGQLTSVILPGGREITYQYDALGNRTVVGDTGGSSSPYMANDLDNEYTAIAGTTYNYDFDGNLITATGPGGTTHYSYDAENRLVGVVSPTDTWTYSYNTHGSVAAMTHNGQTTRYLVDPSGLGNVVAESDGSGNLIADYTLCLGLVSDCPIRGASDVGCG